jgi:hypothetical protein
MFVSRPFQEAIFPLSPAAPTNAHDGSDYFWLGGDQTSAFRLNEMHWVWLFGDRWSVAATALARVRARAIRHPRTGATGLAISRAAQCRPRASPCGSAQQIRQPIGP